MANLKTGKKNRSQVPKSAPLQWKSDQPQNPTGNPEPNPSNKQPSLPQQKPEQQPITPNPQKS